MDPMSGRVGPSVGRKDILKKLLDHVLDNFYSEITDPDPLTRYKQFYREIVTRTAHLVAQWQGVGFCHGVLNTDNMSIVGVTIDYGPFGFLDKYDPRFICNASDDNGRYSYEKQPQICKWNCNKLAESLQWILPVEESSKILEEVYDKEYKAMYTKIMRNKLGLLGEEPTRGDSDLVTDKELMEGLFEAMEKSGADFTNCFRCLSLVSVPGLPEFEESRSLLMEKLMSETSSLEETLKATESGVNPRQLEMYILLMESNPGLLEQLGKRGAIESLIQKHETFKKLKEMTPERKKAEDERIWSDWIGKYVKRLEFETRDSRHDTQELKSYTEKRVQVMNRTNPRIILRNYLAQNAISKAEDGDYREVLELLKALEDPFHDVQPSEERSRFEKKPDTSIPGLCRKSDDGLDMKPPSWASTLKVT